MSLTLVVLAAGIGSRYGGLKQIELVGPGGAIVLDYSVFDARRAGFDALVFVIRRDIEADFRAVVGRHWEGRLPVHYVFQEMGDVPEGFAAPPGRRKPWGTAHAVLVCRDAVREPFAAINADDFYGRASYAVLADFLRAERGGASAYAMVGFRLRNTLSEHGSVARGLCAVDGRGYLQGVVERTRVERDGRGARFMTGDGRWEALTGDEFVSLNMWGFMPSLFDHLRAEFPVFLAESGANPGAEFFLPTVVDALIRRGQATVRVLATPETWFGVTYPEDKPRLEAGIRELIAAGTYPERLWD